MGVGLGRTIPALPARDVAASVAFYNDRLGFETLHHDGGFAVMRRGQAVITCGSRVTKAGGAGTTSWSDRCARVRSFLSGTASCRIEVGGVEALYDELRTAGVLHSIERGDGPGTTDFGTREFATVDPDGNLVTFCWIDTRHVPVGQGPVPGRYGIGGGGSPMIRLGRISYVNMAPLFFRLDADVEEVPGVPTEAQPRAPRGPRRPRADLLDRVRAARGAPARSPGSVSLPKVQSTRSSSSRAPLGVGCVNGRDTRARPRPCSSACSCPTRSRWDSPSRPTPRF